MLSGLRCRVDRKIATHTHTKKEHVLECVARSTVRATRAVLCLTCCPIREKTPSCSSAHASPQVCNTTQAPSPKLFLNVAKRAHDRRFGFRPRRSMYNHTLFMADRSSRVAGIQLTEHPLSLWALHATHSGVNRLFYMEDTSALQRSAQTAQRQRSDSAGRSAAQGAEQNAMQSAVL